VPQVRNRHGRGVLQDEHGVRMPAVRLRSMHVAFG
jgi:hypothetical protein